MSERDSCNSRHFSWLVKSCFPNPHQTTLPTHKPSSSSQTTSAPPTTTTTTVAALPDDVLLECLCRVQPSSLPSLSLVCRRWSRLLHSSHFTDLRRSHSLLQHCVFALTTTESGLSVARSFNGVWKFTLFIPNHEAISLGNLYCLFSHARLCSVGPNIYIIGRNAMLRYDTWSGNVMPRSATLFPRKKFAAAVARRKLYVAGGGTRTTAVEEYEPETDTWRVVANAPRRRYGCIGASADGVFYIIGGLKIGASNDNDFSRAASGTVAHAAYASSMDLFDVESRMWLRSRVVPGGGCVVAACVAGGHLYVLTSHAIELSFWSFNTRRKNSTYTNDRNGPNEDYNCSGFGEWRRLKSPPLPTGVRVTNRVRFHCIGAGETAVVVQVIGCIEEWLYGGGGRSARGSRESIILAYDCTAGEWSRGVDLPEVFRRAACVSVEC